MSLGSQVAEARPPVRESGPASPLPRPKTVVCHISSGDCWAGAEVQLAMLLEALSHRDDLQLLAIFFNDNRLAAEVRSAGIEVVVLPETKNGFVSLIRRASAFLKGRGVRILHTHGYKSNLLAAALAWRLDIPHLVRTQHGRTEPFEGWKRWKHEALQSLDGLVARRYTDRVIGVSDDLAADLTATFGASRVVKIYNGINTRAVRSSLSPAEAKRRLGISPETHLIGIAGRLEPVKRIDIFLAAAREIAAARPDVQFLIAGTGRLEAEWKAQAQQLGLGARVHFLGHRDDVYDVLRALDLFLLCSDHEGLPMVLLEALWLGVPIVGRRVGGIAQVLQDGVSGVLVDSADPAQFASVCLALLADPERLRRLGEAAPRTLEGSYTADRTAQQVAQLYAGLGGTR